MQHFTSLNFIKILDSLSPIVSGRYVYPCSFFQGCPSVMSKCFANIPHSQSYRMTKHYYPHPEAGNKRAYRKPQKNIAEGPEWETWEHTGVPVYLSTSPDCTDHCQKREVALSAVHLLHISDTKSFNVDSPNMKAHIFHGYRHVLFWLVRSKPARLPSQRQRHRLFTTALYVWIIIISLLFTVFHRITKQLRLERSSGGHLVQPPCPCNTN